MRARWRCAAAATGRRSAELVNRFRRERHFEVGDKVLLRDPAQAKRHKEFGKPPLQPAAIEAVRGRHADCRRLVDKVLVRGVHFENLVALPDEIDNWEGADRSPLELDSAAEPSGAASLGQMIDAAAQSRPARGLPLELEARPAARARLRGLEKGRHVVYAGEARRRCRVGRVVEAASAEGQELALLCAKEVDQVPSEVGPA